MGPLFHFKNSELRNSVQQTVRMFVMAVDDFELKTVRERAEGLIQTINRSLSKWRTWFPNEQSMVEVPRADLLALKKYAEIGLRSTKHFDANPSLLMQSECNDRFAE